MIKTFDYYYTADIGWDLRVFTVNGVTKSEYFSGIHTPPGIIHIVSGIKNGTVYCD